MAKSRICSVDGCDKPVLARGWCNAHYLSWHRHGSLEKKKRHVASGTRKFIEDVALQFSADECLDWPYSCFSSGYGKVRIAGSFQTVSRLVCKMAHGDPNSDALEAAHSCGRAICVNPRHLSWKTHSENEADKTAHGTSTLGRQGTAFKLTDDDVRHIRSLKGKMPLRHVGGLFGIHHSTVSDIQNRKRWTWLD